MDGIEFARFVETELATRGIKKGDFYSATGISATALYNWKRGRTPSMESVTAVENYLGVKFSDVSKNETTGMDANADVQRMKDFFATSNATENATA